MPATFFTILPLSLQSELRKSEEKSKDLTSLLFFIGLGLRGASASKIHFS
jgi:hypothetical protein